MQSLKRIIRPLEAISKYSGWAVAMLAIPMIGALIYEVIARYFFNRPTIWSYEITYMLCGIHFLIGSAFTLKLKGHIRIDVFYSLLPIRGRALIDTLGYVIIFFPVFIVLIISALGATREAYQTAEVSQFTPWQPRLWPFKTAIFVGFGLLGLQGLSEFLKALGALITGKEL